MNMLRPVSVVGRALIVMSLLLFSFSAPAMPLGMSADCAAMMQTEDASTLPGEHSNGPICPYIALCAIAGLYISPIPPADYALVAMSGVGFFPFDDTNGVGLVSSPPSRPPSS